uniref:Methyltransferase 8 n=1 Tax=Tanacetum cinerariifolium TaxID=118510 RepID=A0A4P8JIT7_TANCI|nr:methyltransferase 8 [Tanacetum cinerariifolium]
MTSQEPAAMEVADFLRMNTGNPESSYATNSSVQEIAIRKTEAVLKETIKSIANLHGFPQCFNIADLGCSSGPNTLLAISNIIHEVHEVCKEKNLKPPQLQVFLNDLFGNDFNSVFKSLPMFYANYNKEEGENNLCCVSAVPGSFHGRLFPDHSMHFFHSSTSLHWLSQVPKGIENNKLNIYISETSPPNVFENYRMQFQKDFTTFLESRSIEIVHRGRMVLTFLGRGNVDPCSDGSGRVMELLGKSLVDAVNEGFVQESDLNSFNMPVYRAYKDEISETIHNQGSFSLDMLETFEINLDPYDTNYENVLKASGEPNHGEGAAKTLRAVVEPMLVAHFGNSAMECVFKKLEERVAIEKTRFFFILISLTRI